jgi:hypothetical protein
MNIKLPNSVVGPLSQDFLIREDVSRAKKDVWISKIALKVIVGVGMLRVTACLLGMWVFPMDLVMYSGSARVFTIPVTLLGLPLALGVMKITHVILGNRAEKLSGIYHEMLLRHLLENNEPSTALLKEFREISQNIKHVNLDIGNEICEEKLDLILSACSKLESMDISAAALNTLVMERLSEKVCHLRMLRISHCESLSKPVIWSFECKGFVVEMSGKESYLIHKIVKEPVFKDDLGRLDFYDHSLDLWGYTDTGMLKSQLSFAFEWRR